MIKKVVIAGGTGLIGAALARRWRERGHEVVVLTRSEPRRRGDGIREVQWDGRTAGGWAAELEDAAAVVNLAGASINCVHTPENRRRILETRVDSVRAIGAALRTCNQPPAVWVQGSAVGIYGHRAGPCDESTPAGEGFKPDVCKQWEAAFAAECPAAVRGVVLRIGVVFSRKGGAFPELAQVTRRFLGGSAGDGSQGVSWIQIDDVEEIFLRAVADPSMRGVYNACSPEPVSNAELMRTLRSVLGRPWAPPAPAFMIKLIAPWIMGTDASLVLQGQYAVPARLEAEGFRFKVRTLRSALTALASD